MDMYQQLLAGVVPDGYVPTVLDLQQLLAGVVPDGYVPTVTGNLGRGNRENHNARRNGTGDCG